MLLMVIPDRFHHMLMLQLRPLHRVAVIYALICPIKSADSFLLSKVLKGSLGDVLLPLLQAVCAGC